MAERASTDEQAATPVTIYGRTYHLSGPEDGPYLRELAELVDQRMREVVEATDTADTMKVAILAALNIADDYLKSSRGRSGSTDPALRRKVKRMIELLDGELVE